MPTSTRRLYSRTAAPFSVKIEVPLRVHRDHQIDGFVKSLHVHDGKHRSEDFIGGGVHLCFTLSESWDRTKLPPAGVCFGRIPPATPLLFTPVQSAGGYDHTNRSKSPNPDSPSIRAIARN